MSSRSLNKVTLIGNLTRDPELRYTPSGTAVCTFGLATNRSWTTQTGETKEETEFHRIVSWNKLGELCSQLLAKGRKVYVEGRLATRTWQAQDGTQRTSTEIVIEDMIILDSKRVVTEMPDNTQAAQRTAAKIPAEEVDKKDQKSEKTKESENVEQTDRKPKEGENIEQTADKKADKKSAKKTPDKEAATKGSVDLSEDIAPEDIPF